MRRGIALAIVVVPLAWAGCGGSSTTSTSQGPPLVANQKLAEAKDRLTTLGYDVAVQRVAAKGTKPGRVVAQTPDPVTESVTKGQTVTLEVSTGPPPPSPFRAKITVTSDSLSTELVYPVANECQISNNYTRQTIYAGGDPDSQDHSTGLFFISWSGQHHPNGPNKVRIPNAGTLRITGVHLDRHATTRPQGELAFTSKNGIEGVLHLADNTVTTTGIAIP